MKRFFSNDRHYGPKAALTASLILLLLVFAGQARQAPAPHNGVAGTSPTLARNLPAPNPSLEEPPPPPGPPRPPLERWRETDRRLRECRKKFDQIETRREDLLNKLAVERKRYAPGRMNPGAVLSYKAIDRLLGQLHQLVELARPNAEEAGLTLEIAMTTRRNWEPILNRELARPAATPPTVTKEERARQGLWLQAARRMDQDGENGFAKTLLGESFGPIALEALPERLALNPGLRPKDLLGQPPARRGGRGPLKREASDALRQRWLERLDRLEWRQEELQEMFKRQQREIDRLRQIIGESAPPPGATPPAPGARRQPASAEAPAPAARPR